MTHPSALYKPGHNCRTIETARHACVLIDYATYYDALYSSLLKAKKSIFVLGWDIDSRIELRRGEDVDYSGAPVTFSDVVCKVAKERPDVQVYLNKWDYSYFFMKQREPLWQHKWEKCGLENIHPCLDGVVPLGACHHQKIVVIDDELAFWGGMDVAQGRWDKREHHPRNHHRADPGGLPSPDTLHKFGPYHDIQAVLCGPAVRAFAQQVRERWKLASDIEPVPYQPPADMDALPASWPDDHKPGFDNAAIAVARTVPPMKGEKLVDEVRHLLLDEIAQAKNFIYMENQYVANLEIARALNKALRANPDLRVLIVSCDHPQGIMEAKVMWANRVRFRDVIEEGGAADRVAMVNPISSENGLTKPVHIHSKLTIIDDRYLHIGSANICNRSMGLDTEWDVSIAGDEDAIRKQITATRNDLIREHCGREIADIQNIITSQKSVQTFLEDVPTSRQHFRRLEDEEYRDQRFIKLATFFGDPKKPLIPTDWTIRFHRGPQRRAFYQGLARFGILIAVIAALAAIWRFTPLSDYTNTQTAASLFARMGDSPSAIAWGIGLYTIGGLIFFPITVMTAAAVVAFGPIKGVIVGFAGALMSGVLGYAVGRAVRMERLKKFFGDRSEKVMKKIKGSGVIGVALIRSVPLAPYPLINMVFGASGISLAAFIIGTFLGLAPGKVALALAGDSLVNVVKDPSPANIGYVAIGIAVWIAVIAGSHTLAKRWQDKAA